MACAYCKRKNFELMNLMEHQLTAKFIIKRYPHIKITDVICSRCYTSADIARKQFDNLSNKKHIISDTSLESMSTLGARTLFSRDVSARTNTLDQIDDLIYKTPQYQENITNAKRIHMDRDIGGTIGVQLYEARKNQTVHLADTPVASKTSNENQQLIERLIAFVPSDNEVQSVIRDNSISSTTSTTSRINDEHFNSPPKKRSRTAFNSATNLISIENIPIVLTSNSDDTVSSTPNKTANKKNKNLDRPMPKFVKKKLNERRKKANEENKKKSPAAINKPKPNFHSSQEAGPSGINKNVANDPLEDLEVSDDEFPDIQSLEPADSLVHTRPIIPKRKQPIVFSNKDQMDIYLARNNFGG